MKMTARKKGNTDMTAGIGGKLFNRPEEAKEEKPKKKASKEAEIDEPETGPEVLQNEQEITQATDIPLDTNASSKGSDIALNDAPSCGAVSKPKSLNVSDRGLLSKKDNRSHRISIFVTEDRYNTLQALKKTTGVSVNSMINSAIDQLIEDNREYLAKE